MKKKKELEKIKSKFLELKNLVYEYKDNKEIEIKSLINNHEDLKKEIDKTKNDYEKILDETAKQIDEFVDKVNLENNIQ